MLFEKIKTPGLAHNSYLIGDAGEAVVIDPRRDVDIYLQKAVEAGYAIKTVLETHRNEDYLVGSLELKKKTGADLYHADASLDYQYGQAIEEGQRFKFGRLYLEALHTPGHTPGSRSYVLYGYEEEPLMVFTGDVLFAGDVGRVDFLGEDKLEETASALYDSIFNKIFPLGDEVIICPAHGAGSVCASAIADREWTTIGIEKKLNPKLQVDDKEEFIEKVAKMLEYNPYFKKMEEENLAGAAPLSEYAKPAALTPEEFANIKESENAIVIDTRMEVSFATAHVEGSLSIWKDNLTSFTGWFAPLDEPILLVTEGDYPKEEIKHLYRIGYDDIRGYLGGGIIKWHMAGKKSSSINTVTVDKLCNIIDGSEEYFILDVRAEDEVEEEGEIKDATNIHLTQLPDNLAALPKDKPIYIFCGSGIRSMTAASVLKNKGFANLNVVLGGLMGWSSTACPIV